MLNDLALEELVPFDVEARLHELNEKVAGDLNILVFPGDQHTLSLMR